MATRRKSAKQRNGKEPRRRSEVAGEIADEIADEELALAEELLRVSRKERAHLVAGSEKYLKQLGIRGIPIDAKKLRDMLLKRGFDPEGNEFSQGIVAMREE
jgi:hypothetical protein